MYVLSKELMSKSRLLCTSTDESGSNYGQILMIFGTKAYFTMAHKLMEPNFRKVLSGGYFV